MRIVFLGSDAIALPLLEWLGRKGGADEVVAVFTQPDRPAGRGRKVLPNPVKSWAGARGLPVFQPERLADGDRNDLAASGADLALVMAYGHILRDDFIRTPRLGTLNLHASLLPKYRGASPIQAAIASGETTTGVSLMRVVRRLDAGPVADIEAVPILPLDTALEVESRLAAACVPLLERALPGVARGDLPFLEQDSARATYCRKLGKADGALDFSAPAGALAARINALFPWPGCSLEIANRPLRIGLAGQEPHIHASEPGTVLAADAGGVLVACGEGALRLLRLQRPGGRMLPAGEFVRGLPIPPGTRLPSRPMTLLVERK